jgi:hypothetical protein
MINRSRHKCDGVSILRAGVLHSDGSPELTLASLGYPISIAATGRFFSRTIWAQSAACAIAVLAASPSIARDYMLTPIQHYGQASGIRLVVSQPAGWRRWGEEDPSMVAFVPDETPTAVPYTTPYHMAQLEVTSEMVGDLKVSGKELENPRNASLVSWMSSGTDIELIKKVKVFDAGRLGKLPIWLIQGKAYSYYLVVTVRDGVQLQVGLRSDSRALTGEKSKREAARGRVLEELKRHGATLKELVRSIRITKSK